MRRFLTITAAVAVGWCIPALAVEPEPGVVLGTRVGDIAAALNESGYEITKYEREPRYIEVDAIRDGREWELKIDLLTGQVLTVKEDRD